MLIIGISGKKSAGKDTIADHLVENHGFGKLAFASSLKCVARELFLFSDAQLHDPIEKEQVDPRWGISPRRAFQMIGTDWVRNQLDPDFWVRRLECEIRALPQTARVVISDVRFPNEKKMVERLGGKMIGVVKPHAQTDTDETASHESENAIDELLQDCLVFVNGGTITDLRQHIDDWLVRFC